MFKKSNLCVILYNFFLFIDIIDVWLSTKPPKGELAKKLYRPVATGGAVLSPCLMVLM